jgi:nucleotide-binding universal stress UspA family protein
VGFQQIFVLLLKVNIMKRILCPTDFSEASINAIEFAAKIGETHHSKLTLVYIFMEDQIQNVLGKGGSDLSFEEWKILAEEKLQNIAKEVNEASVPNGLMECDYLMVVGDLTKTVVKLCKKEKYDVIIMGTSGVRDVTEQYMGSNTFKVINASHCPVICVPIRAQYNNFKKIVYATDYQEEDKIMVQELIYFCYPFDAQLSILHISKSDSLIDQAAYEQFKEDIKNFIVYDNLNFVRKTYKDDIALGIDEFMNDEKANLLVLLSRHRNFFEQIFHNSIIKKMSYFADYPILIYKG